MKSLLFLLAGIGLTCALYGCSADPPPEITIAPSESSSTAAEQSASTDPEAEKPHDVTTEPSPSATSGSAEETRLKNAYGLVKYDTIQDIPFIDLEFGETQNELTKNGEPWIAAPGTAKFGDLCFSDGKTLYIQCIFSDSNSDFGWFYTCFDHWHDSTSLPEETYNKLFTYADGYTLYTDDEYQYTVTPCETE